MHKQIPYKQLHTCKANFDKPNEIEVIKTILQLDKPKEEREALDSHSVRGVRRLLCRNATIESCRANPCCPICLFNYNKAETQPIFEEWLADENNILEYLNPKTQQDDSHEKDN